MVNFRYLVALLMAVLSMVGLVTTPVFAGLALWFQDINYGKIAFVSWIVQQLSWSIAKAIVE